MKILYRIVDWKKHYETAETASKVRNMRRVYFPNKHDGEGYSELTDHPSGAAHLGAWTTIPQIASKCIPRGVLIRNDGRPHDAQSLARKARLSVDVYEEVIPRLVVIGWLEELQVTDIQLAEMCKLTDPRQWAQFEVILANSSEGVGGSPAPSDAGGGSPAPSGTYCIVGKGIVDGSPPLTPSRSRARTSSPTPSPVEGARGGLSTRGDGGRGASEETLVQGFKTPPTCTVCAPSGDLAGAVLRPDGSIAKCCSCQLGKDRSFRLSADQIRRRHEKDEKRRRSSEAIGLGRILNRAQDADRGDTS
ncbi:MAG: hypothetical protein LN413_00120 [Candidatus Thermoplasmatota archaeon]|nr:hypothetical protein [Candidatus Thermoplasmatota archaeon]